MSWPQHYVATGYVEAEYSQTGVTINWLTRVITVPKFFLTFISGTRYQLDLNDFRNALKDIEDDLEGIVHPPTHRHNTTVVLSGVTYSMVLELINGYTVTFEAGPTPYSVDLIGANSNVADVTNLNHVQIRASNSAGLQMVSGGSTPSQVADAVWAHSTAIQALSEVAFIKAIEGGRWKIVANQMIFYSSDNVTEIARFDLKAANGSPTMNNPMERVRV
jgi:hypothetical protein